MTSDTLLLEKPAPGVLRVTLNRPAVLNAVNLAMRDELWLALHAIDDDPDVRVAVFAGAGERAFSAGADITEFGTAPSYVEARRARQQRDVWGRMLAVRKPLLAAIHGYAFGAGCELALCCDLRIASDDASFALPEVKLGYIPSAGGTQLLPRTVHPGVAREMILAGEPIDASRALELGLVSEVVPKALLEERTLTLAARLAALEPAAASAAKHAVSRGLDIPFEQGLALERMLSIRLARTRR